MTISRPRCRHWQEPRHRGAALCRSPNLVGSRLVTPDFCEICPFFEKPDFDTPGTIHSEMSLENLAALLEQPPRVWPTGWEDWPVTADAHFLASERFLHRLGEYPEGEYGGKGIVIAGGGRAFFPSVYVTVRAIRYCGCTLPIQVWFLGREDEMPPRNERLLGSYGVKCIDADEVRKQHPSRILNGWELKVFALVHSTFEEMLLLDADCYPVRDPSFLFEDAGYAYSGAIFWPDSPGGQLGNWHVFRVQPPGRTAIESGQLVVNKRTCWRPLQLAWWYNDHSEWTYLHAYGDKHTFEIAWARLGVFYWRFQEIATWSMHSFVRSGPDGVPLFIHRCRDKFRFESADYMSYQIFAENKFHLGLPFEKECFGWLAELAAEFNGEGS